MCNKLVLACLGKVKRHIVEWNGTYLPLRFADLGLQLQLSKGFSSDTSGVYTAVHQHTACLKAAVGSLHRCCSSAFI